MFTFLPFFFVLRKEGNLDEPLSMQSLIEKHLPLSFCQVFSPNNEGAYLTPVSTRKRNSVELPTTPFINYQKEKLNEFLQCSGVSSVKIPDLDISSVSSRTKRRYITCACDVIATVVRTLSPSNPGRLWEVLRSSSKLCDDFNIPKNPVTGTVKDNNEELLQALAETYVNASSRNVKRQVHSTIADLTTLKKIRTFIPGLTKYMFCEARKHRLQYGRGVLVMPKAGPRTRYDADKLDDFLDFITSPYIIQDLPFGQRKLKLSSGEVLQTPNVIRVSVNERIIDQYIHYCKESDKIPLSRSTLRRILSACQASSRKSLQGLDYYSTEGSNAFDDLIKLADKLVEHGYDSAVAQELQTKLKLGKNYIKSDFKVSLSV